MTTKKELLDNLVMIYGYNNVMDQLQYDEFIKRQNKQEKNNGKQEKTRSKQRKN